MPTRVLVSAMAKSWVPRRGIGAEEQSLFEEELESDPLVLFHATPARNLDSILLDGFRSAFDLGVGLLTSVSYSKRSDCWSNRTGYPAERSHVVFAVRFESLAVPGIRVDTSDIHVDCQDIQPAILGYVEIPEGYR